MRVPLLILLVVALFSSTGLLGQSAAKKTVKSKRTPATQSHVVEKKPVASPASSIAAPVAIARFSLPALPYGYAALEPVIDSLTMVIHHTKHHQAYVTNLNIALGEANLTEPLQLEWLMAHISNYTPAMRNNGGGHYNHSLFWQIMAPVGHGGGGPQGALAAHIERTFGSFDSFKEAFAKAGTSRFGSGWVWLIVQADGSLKITSTPNQDNPLMDVVPAAERGQPILALDVWEHAYYLKYQNRRADYVANWWQVVNWQEVERLYLSALPK